MRLWLAMGLLMICGIVRAEPVMLRDGVRMRAPAQSVLDDDIPAAHYGEAAADELAAPETPLADAPSTESAPAAPRNGDKRPASDEIAASARAVRRTPPQAVPVTPGMVLPALRNVIPASPAETPQAAGLVVPVGKTLDLQERAKAPPEVQSARTRVFATTDGRFHRRDCRFAREALPLSRGEAVAKKLKPCTACRP